MSIHVRGEREPGFPEEAAVAALHHEHERGRLHERQRDGEVAGPLGDLLLAGLAFVLPLFELGDHDAEQLHDDRRGDVGHDPEREHRAACQRPSGEQVEEADRAAGAVRRRVLQGEDGVEVDVRDGEVESRAGRSR